MYKQKYTKKRKQELPVVEMRNVTKVYSLRHEKPTFVEKILSQSRVEHFKALKKVTLSIPAGERVAIIGQNGSGKTTLLKIICGITKPQEGYVKTRGKVVSLIDLEAGFHPEMNGYENIHLNGLVIGMSRKEISEKMEAIVDFAGIGSFIDAPMFTYSEGMKLRLGFSVAIHSEPDILVLDEMFVTGDEGFQQKSSKKIDEIFEQGKTVITVSHVMPFLEKYFNSYIWLDKGEVKSIGGKEVITDYKKFWK